MGNQDDEITPCPPPYNEKSRETVQAIERANSSEESDEFDGLVEPTPEQLESLRRVSETIPLRAW